MTIPEREIEYHELGFFLPPEATVLMLGSFHPQRKRWSMEFFYPNLQNDMWRIFGCIFFADKEHFLEPDKKRFDKDRIQRFLAEKGIALGDTAQAVVRLNDNASDKFLEVVEPLNLSEILPQIPRCRTLVTTGQKATETLLPLIGASEPKVGGCSLFRWEGQEYRIYRMPSSSRAYPRPVEEKARVYERMFLEIGLL